jgi:fido (protein-threonine AMPylation protein)
MADQIDAFAALLASSSPRVLIDQLSYVDGMAVDQQSAADAKAQYDAQKAPIDAVVADLAKQDADLAAQRTAIEAKLSDLQ